MQVAYVENMPCITYILHMVAKCELQCCTGEKCYVTHKLYNTHAHARHMQVAYVQNVTCVYYILHMVRSRQDDHLTSCLILKVV